MSRPDHLREFVLPIAPSAIESREVGSCAFDLYLPVAARSAVPVTVLVHGGPMREDPVVAPRQWPVFRGYATALAARGVAAAMFDHALLRSLDYGKASSQLDDVVDAVRALPEIDDNRVALWFFSGGGPLAVSALDDPPSWLRTIALSYPMLRPLGDMSGFTPTTVLAAAGRVPILLTRVGREHPQLAAEQDDFVTTARSVGVDLTVIEVPDGQHAFDIADDNDQSRHALEKALDFIETRLR